MKRIPSFFIALALGFTTLSAQAGLTTDTLGVNGPQAPATNHPAAPLPPPPVHVNGDAAIAWITGIAGDLPPGESIRLSDLFLDPEFFDLMHGSGPEADELRGYMDWLMMTSVVIGLKDGGVNGLIYDGGDHDPGVMQPSAPGIVDVIVSSFSNTQTPSVGQPISSLSQVAIPFAPNVQPPHMPQQVPFVANDATQAGFKDIVVSSLATKPAP